MSKKDKGAEKAPEGVSVAGHPRARQWIRRARAFAALGTFALVVLVAHRTVGGQTALARGLVAGVAAYLVVWAAAVALWRSIVVAEVRAEHAARVERRRAALEPPREVR